MQYAPLSVEQFQLCQSSEAANHGFVPAHLPCSRFPLSTDRRRLGTAGSDQVDIDTIGTAILMARDKGYATADEEFGLGLMGVSAPVRDHTGRIVAAINVSATRSQIGGRINEIGAVVEAAADDLSEALGFVIAPLRRVTGPA